MTSPKGWKGKNNMPTQSSMSRGVCRVPENKMSSLFSLGISELNKVKQVSVLHEFLVN